MSKKVGELVEKYIMIRDKKAELVAGHKEELAPYNEAMSKLEDVFQKAMLDNGLESLKTDHGTAYQSTQSSVTVADWEVFRDWVAENNAWHMFDKRAAKTAVEEYLEAEGSLPPGLDRKSSIKINVRRS